MTQKETVKQYFLTHPNVELPTAEVVDWAKQEYERVEGKTFRDPDRQIRTLYDKGFLQKISTGIYKYDPDAVTENEDLNFSQEIIDAAKRRDNYKCVVCGKGEAEGYRIMVDHIKARHNGGLPTLDNAQTLCGNCHNLKHTYGQTAFGKKIFFRLREKAVQANDETMLNFINDILEVYSNHHIDDEIQD